MHLFDWGEDHEDCKESFSVISVSQSKKRDAVPPVQRMFYAADSDDRAECRVRAAAEGHAEGDRQRRICKKASDGRSGEAEQSGSV